MKHSEIDPLYSQLIQSVLRDGQESAPRGQPVKELYNVGFKLEDAHNGIIQSPYRKMNYAYAIIEMLGLLRDGKRNLEPYCWYNSVMKSFVNPETGLWDGSYADRLYMYKQLPAMYNILINDPDSRRAVMAMYNPAHDLHESLDICCTLSLIFRLREGKLNLTVTMRSNDVYLGLPYDLSQFTFLQSVLASWLGVEMGEYFHFTANLHAYEQNWERLTHIATTPWHKQKGFRMPDWDIYSIEETYRDIERFFASEKAHRDGGAAEAPRSKVLQGWLTDVIIPYQQHKLSK